jgi:hydroxymethylbilane synthase
MSEAGSAVEALPLAGTREPPAARLVVGTRASALARWQADWVSDRLRAAWPGLEVGTKLLTTSGDRLLHKPLPEIGGKGLFTLELEAALRSGEIDLAVHSLKDLPVEEADGLALAAICAREDAHDVLIARDGGTLAALPEGARVGTSSVRRAAQLLAARPDLSLASLRGNVDTRIRKAEEGQYDAIVLAAAGVRRLKLDSYIAEVLPFEVMLPAPGQGALAVQCRAEDAITGELLAALDQATSRAAVTAERAFLEALGGGCAAPVAAYAEFPQEARGEGRLDGLVAATDGSRVVRVSGGGSDPRELGAELARQAMEAGAGELLA